VKSALTGLTATGLSTILVALLNAGCQRQQQEQPQAQPFVFRSLQLRQRDSRGRLLWEISSPETRYDLSRRLAQSRQLSGVIYQQGRPLYKVSATTAVVINDGEVVQLEGPTRLERLDRERPAVVTAQRLRWYPNQERMEIDRAPRAVQGNLELSAGLARFLLDTERLELRRQPRLVQRGEEPLRLELGDLDWWPGSGRLRGRGPIQGRRQLGSGAEQKLTAPALSGNTTTQILDLQAPVSLESPAEQAALSGGATRLNLLDRTIASDAAFQARYRQARLSGNGYTLNGRNTTVRVLGGCRLQQAGDALTARTCSWNWTTDAVSARGDVWLQRSSAGLNTRGQQLDGRLGDRGFALVRAPGGRVRTQARVRAGGPLPPTAGSPRQPTLRAAPEPPFRL
jgi:LPS export ABC transporter protein LptC